MTQPTWRAVDKYLTPLFVGADPVLGAALEHSASSGLPPIAVSAVEGKFLHLIARSAGVKRILEIGTLGGYSTIWMARALPSDGALVSLELDAKHAQVATENVARAGLSALVDIRVGRATDLLQQLIDEHVQPFDMIFVDADKPAIPDYFQLSLTLSRSGTIIIVDNVIRDGAVADVNSTDASIVGIRRFNERISRETRVSATTIQTVGSKGYDGFAFVVVN